LNWHNDESELNGVLMQEMAAKKKIFCDYGVTLQSSLGCDFAVITCALPHVSSPSFSTCFHPSFSVQGTIKVRAIKPFGDSTHPSAPNY